jgi:predicted GNAT family N-acyltransferase
MSGPTRTSARWPATSTATLADALDVRLARNDEELRAALELRRRVFCDEQGVSPAADRDGHDLEAIHVVAVEDGGEVVGTCRLLFRGQIARLGRLAVERSARRRGIGAAILGAAADVARTAGATEIDLHAQTYALDLYRNEGYRQRGEEFVEEGIPHVAMRKSLA